MHAPRIRFVGAPTKISPAVNNIRYFDDSRSFPPSTSTLERQQSLTLG